MKKPIIAALGVVVILLALLSFSAFFVVDQTEQAIVFQFGEPKRVVDEPGLNMKTPFVQNVVIFDKRILNLDPPAAEIILADQKRVLVDAFARYRIVDPLKYFQTLRTERGTLDRVGTLLNSAVRSEVGKIPLTALLSAQRDNIMALIHSQVRTAGNSLGIDVIDVRIVRTELPDQISKTVYDRMQSERIQEAFLLRAEGEELKQSVSADADRQATIIVADANREARERQGNGDATRNRILVEAFGKDPKFFAFYRSMIAYKAVLNQEDTTYVLSPKSEFLRYFNDLSGFQQSR
jgi:membrane protease subunit HflC